MPRDSPWSDDIEDVSNKIEDLEEKVEKIGQKVDPLSINRDVFLLLDDLSYPYGLKNYAKKFKFLGRTTTWIEEKYGEEIKGISVRSNPDEPFFKVVCLKFRSGTELVKFSEQSSLQIKPILLYYGLVQIYSGFIDCVFKHLNHDVLSHGLRYLPNDGISGNIWAAIIEKYGFFDRVKKCLEFLTQFPLLFYDYRWIGKKPTLREFNIVKPLSINTDSLKIDLTQLNQDFILRKSPSMVEEVNLIDQILLDVVNLFAFASLARYNPYLWLQHLQGATIMYKIMQDTFRRVYSDINAFSQCLFISDEDLSTSWLYDDRTSMIAL